MILQCVKCNFRPHFHHRLQTIRGFLDHDLVLKEAEQHFFVEAYFGKLCSRPSFSSSGPSCPLLLLLELRQLVGAAASLRRAAEWPRVRGQRTAPRARRATR